VLWLHHVEDPRETVQFYSFSMCVYVHIRAHIDCFLLIFKEKLGPAKSTCILDNIILVLIL
jgi:hypothetical protein